MKSLAGNWISSLHRVACWFRAQLTEQMHRLVLSSEQMRLPSPPSRQKGFRVDGSNLPWVVDRLQHNPGLLHHPA